MPVASSSGGDGRRGGPGRVRRPGHGRPGRRPAGWTCARRTGSRTSRSACWARCTGTSCGCTRRCWTGCAPRRRAADLASVGIDSWGVDYGLLDADGRAARQPGALPGQPDRGGGRPGAGRDPGRGAVRGHRHPAAAVQHDLPARRGGGHAAAGRGADPAADPGPARLLADRARSGPRSPTRPPRSCSTCGRRSWAGPPDRAGRAAARAVPAAAPARRASSATLRPEIAAEAGLAAAAAAGDRGRLARHRVRRGRACPRQGRDFAYISCGTWSLVGMELDQPVLTEASRRGELHQRDRRRRHDPLPAQRDGPVAAAGVGPRRGRPPGGRPDLADAAGAAARVPAAARRWSTPTTPRSCPRATCPPGSPRRPGGPASGRQPIRPAVVRCILDSLALAYRRALREVQELSGRAVDTVHLVGGGARNDAAAASSPRTPAGCPWWPARPRRPRSATSWSRRARWAPRPATWTGCARCCAAPSRCAATSPRVRRGGLGGGRPPDRALIPR